MNRAGQSLIEVLVAVVVMGSASLLFSGTAATYNAMQDQSRNLSAYQDLARAKLEQLLHEQPGQLLAPLGAATLATLDTMALPIDQAGAELKFAIAGRNAVDIGALRVGSQAIGTIARTVPSPDDPLLDRLELSLSIAAAKLQPLGGRQLLYKYQVTVLRRNPDTRANDPVYVLSALDDDFDPAGR